VKLPRPAGIYEARLFLSGSHYNEQSILEFTNPKDCINAVRIRPAASRFFFLSSFFFTFLFSRQ
jgi:hypothetical protein